MENIKRLKNENDRGNKLPYPIVEHRSIVPCFQKLNSFSKKDCKTHCVMLE
jgi:hypothetical protein